MFSKNIFMPYRKALTTGTFCLSAAVLSVTSTVSAEKNSGVTSKLSPSVMEVLEVYATPLHSSTIESALPVNVISGDELKLKQASTLGETLKNEVGVHSSFYGSVASSPIIRGLDGPRVLITQNGLDAGDASRVGADHAVATETSTATQIEVLRGPATLFYGSGAIGGVVNVVDNRVPTSSDTLIDWLLQYNDVSNEKQGSFSLQTGNDNIAVHLDGFWRDAGDYKLPKGFDADALEDEHEEHEEKQPTHLTGSDSKSSGFTLGSSYLFDQGFVGFSYGLITRDYGIPGHSHHEEEHEEELEEHEEGTKAEMQQDRFQLLSEANFNQGFIKQLAAKFAYTDYQHQEIEDGAVGTTFTNKSIEIKADLYHQDYLGWQGA
ncbi:MAG: TonB-dependent receptor plug domain-containing protein, partial [Colwellia sp.]|nr:TonB-dependent receptor plug domain-containing protein [Colwellia sp.]